MKIGHKHNIPINQQILCYNVHIRGINNPVKHNNDGQIITAGELVVKAKYLCYTKIDTNWYWSHQPKHHVITVTTRSILHPQLEVNAKTDFHEIPTSLCSRTQAKKPYQDSLYVLLMLTMITYQKKLVVGKKLGVKENQTCIVTIWRINMSILNEYCMYLLFILFLIL